jgi:hypothetical protein
MEARSKALIATKKSKPGNLFILLFQINAMPILPGGAPGNSFATKSTMTAVIAMLLVSCFAIAVIGLHFLRPDYNPLQRFISEYAVGSYGIVMRLAFFCLSAGSLALAISLYRSISGSARSYTALILLLGWSICVFIAGIFPTDLAGSAETSSGSIHDKASLIGFVSIVLASFFLLRFRRDEKWKKHYRSSLLLSLIMMITFLTFMASIIMEFRFIGLIQRLFIMAVLLWLVITARRIQTTNA